MRLAISATTASAAARGSAAWVDRAADDEVVGAVADRLGRRRDALLVAGGRARRPDAGGDEKHVTANGLARHRRLGGARHQSVDAKRERLLGAAPDRLDHPEPAAGVEEIGVVIGGQHRDGENSHSRAFGAGDRGAHRLRIGVDGEECRAELRRLRGRPLDGVGNVMQLEVEKDLFARRRELGDERQAAAIGELHADLIECRAVADPLDEASRLGRHRPYRGRRSADRAAQAGSLTSTLGASRRAGRSTRRRAAG